MATTRFSDRHGFEPSEAEITIRHEAPERVRSATIAIAEEAGLYPSDLRTVLCRVLRLSEDRNNWSERPNIANEVEDKLARAEWWEVYDFIEAIDEALARPTTQETRERGQPYFRKEINRFFRKGGIGWQLRDGKIEIRGSEEIEETFVAAEQVLDQSDLATASRELQEARADLSRRPDPDLTGAIQHSLAALECAARHVSGRSETLGALIDRVPDLFPKPLDQAVKKLYGFASEMGRHLHEGREPTFEDAELTVSLAVALTTHLVRGASDH